MSRWIISALLICTFLGAITCKELSALVKVCKRSPTLDQCLKESIESLRTKFKHGIPGLNIPSLEPLVIPYYTVEQEKTQANFSDVRIYNLTKYKIMDIKSHPDNLTLHAKFNFEDVKVVSNYTLVGRAVFVTVNGKGGFELNFDEVDIDLTIVAKKILHDGRKYLHLKDLNVTMTPKKLRVWADNLVDGDPSLSLSIMKMINDNVMTYYQLSAPAFNKIVADAIRPVLTFVLKRWSLDEIFPK